MTEPLFPRSAGRAFPRSVAIVAVVFASLLPGSRSVAQHTTSTLEADAPATPTLRISDTSAKLVYVVPLKGEVEKGLYIVIARALKEAEAEGADAFVLDMHTPGGRVDSAMLIRDVLVSTDIPTYTYVDNMAISAGAFIALATKKIVMGPGSNIGGALPITVGPEGATAADKKFTSIFASEMRKTAKKNGHSEEIAEAFCNPDFELPGLKEKGDILTLDYDDAVSVGLAAYISPSLEDMLDTEGLGGARLERVEFTPTDRVARFLSNPVVMGILMMMGMGGIYFEVRTPGIGFPGFIGVTALGLYFFGSYLANLSGYMEIIFFSIGLVLIAAEIFVIPGFGVAGISGIVLVLGALTFALFNRPPPDFDFNFVRIRVPVWTLLISLTVLMPTLVLIEAFLPRLLARGVFDLTPQPAGDGPAILNAPVDKVSLAIGMRGRAITDLRPTGTAKFKGQRLDVVTEGDYVAHDVEIEIVNAEGNRIVVREVTSA